MVEVKLFDKKTEIKEGMKLVVPVYGVGTITAISEQEILGEKLTFCNLLFDNNLKISIPLNKMFEMKVRNIVSMETAKNIMKDILDKNHKVNKNSWNKRLQAYKEALESGDAFLIAELVRDLFICTKDFRKSYGERDIYHKAFELLIKELSIALGEQENEVSKMIIDILNKNIKCEKFNIEIDRSEDEEMDDFEDEDFDDDEEEDKIKYKKKSA